jgi:hypothetical protein
MTPLLKKLNFKNQKTIVLVNAPASFATELSEMATFAEIQKEVKETAEIEFVICFLSSKKEIEDFMESVKNKLKGDATIWLCYPKGSSKKYKCDFNRDTGWDDVARFNLEPVRQVAIDEDWSALRFRKVNFIKTITRRESFALTSEAKERTSQKGV